MNAKEVKNILCPFCESDFKLIFDVDDVSGNEKFCPFCGDELYDPVDKGEAEENED